MVHAGVRYEQLAKATNTHDDSFLLLDAASLPSAVKRKTPDYARALKPG